jgi:BirA family transcriptional regulator, biotin operon repressor / biotin---[acetyl-CoA-carboxylase] ligase
LSDLREDIIASGLTTRWLARHMEIHESVGSTMDIARSLERDGAPDGTLILAEEQTAGRGQWNRRWYSASGLGIWASVILPRTVSPGVLAWIAACAVRGGLQASAGIPATVKWPNDVLVPREPSETLPDDVRMWPDGAVRSCGKIAGLLAEATDADRYVLGFGVNVSHTPDEFPPDVRDVATSVLMASGRDIPRTSVIAAIMNHLDEGWLDHEMTIPRDEWRMASSVLGRHVRAETPGGSLDGKVVDIDPGGGLIIETATGSCCITSGTVRLHSRR